MTKVFHVTTVHLFLDPRIYLKQCSSLAYYGYEVTVLGNCDRKQTKINGFNVISIGRPTRKIFCRLLRQFSIIKKILIEKPEIIHFHDPELLPLMFFLAGRKGMKRRIIFDMHENYGQVSGDTIMRKFLSNIYRIILPMAENRMSFILAEDSYSKFCRRTHNVIHNYPINNLRIINSGKKNQVVYLGTITENRGAINMIRGFAEANLQDWELLIIGSFDQPKLKARMIDLAKRLGIEEQINILGYMPLKQALVYVKQSKIGLSLLLPTPNYLNSLPTKVFEYIMCGLYIVMSDFSYYDEYFRKVPGISFVDPTNIKEIGAEIRRFAELDQSANNLIKDRQTVINLYSWESEEKKLLYMYDCLLNSPKGTLL